MLRMGVVQTVGTAGDSQEWGCSWGVALRNLGADLGVLYETCIASAAQRGRQSPVPRRWALPLMSTMSGRSAMERPLLAKALPSDLQTPID